MRECSPPQTCHMSGVTCHVSRVTLFFLFLFFFYKVVELIGGGSFNNGATPSSFTRYSCIYPMSHCICLKLSPNNTVFSSNIITKPHKMHFSHSYKGLRKCTFLKLCTMHFCTARTIVHWTVTTRMEARTFLKTPALTTLPLSQHPK